MFKRTLVMLFAGALLSACQSEPNLEACTPSKVPFSIGDEDFTGRVLKAEAVESPYRGDAILSLTFDKRGTAQLAEVTGENIGNALAMHLDGRLVSEPIVHAAILGGTVEVTGNLTDADVAGLVQSLSRQCE